MILKNPEVRIENTSSCNAKCVICPREKMTRPKVFMPQGHFEYLVDQSADLGAKLISVFGYGEPLLDKHVARKVKYCTDKGLDTFITTNASVLKTDLAKALLSAGLSHMRFSVHGTAKYYDKVHTGLNYDTVIRNISNFTAIAKLRYPEVRISVSVIPMHNENIDSIIQSWEGFDLEIWKPHNWGTGRDYRRLSENRKKTCGRPRTGPVQIQADGKVIPCCFLTNGEIILGDTYKNTIEEILKSKPYQELRKKHETGDLTGLVCDMCDQLNEGDSPLIYSTVDPDCKSGKTSSTKFELNNAA